MPHKRRKAASAMKRMRVQLSRIKLDKSGRSLWFLPKDIGEIF